MTVTLKESSRLIEEAQNRELQLLSTVKSLEQKVHSLTERDHEVSIQGRIKSVKGNTSLSTSRESVIVCFVPKRT